MGRSLAKWDMVLVLAYTLLLCCKSSPKPYTHALLIGPVSSITFCITAEMMLGFHLTEIRKTEGFFSPSWIILSQILYYRRTRLEVRLFFWSGCKGSGWFVWSLSVAVCPYISKSGCGPSTGRCGPSKRRKLAVKVHFVSIQFLCLVDNISLLINSLMRAMMRFSTSQQPALSGRH